MRGLLGKKIGMTQIFDSDGHSIPVTVFRAGPCFVTQVKTNEIDGYSSIQAAFEEAKESIKSGKALKCFNDLINIMK